MGETCPVDRAMPAIGTPPASPTPTWTPPPTSIPNTREVGIPSFYSPEDPDVCVAANGITVIGFEAASFRAAMAIRISEEGFRQGPATRIADDRVEPRISCLSDGGFVAVRQIYGCLDLAGSPPLPPIRPRGLARCPRSIEPVNRLASLRGDCSDGRTNPAPDEGRALAGIEMTRFVPQPSRDETRVSYPTHPPSPFRRTPESLQPEYT